MIQKSDFSCSRGGLTIRGLEFLPETCEGKLPAAIISHGFTANYDSVEAYARQFAEWGFAAYCFDFCGGCAVGRSDGKQSDMSVLTEREDLKAVMDYVQSRSYVGSAPVILMGCSQGGFVSALTGAQLPERVSALVLFYPALCIPDNAREGSMVTAKFDPNNIPEIIPCGPMTLGRVYPASVLEMDPFEETRSFPGPVLLVHGTSDGLVNVSYSEKAYQAYTDGQPESHPEKRLVLIEGADHGFAPQYDEIAVASVKQFLQDNRLL